MGFALGASFFFGMYGRNVTESGVATQHEQRPANETAKSKKEESDEALAYYTLWLMVFPGVLAFATVGLGVATMFLYATGEKQFRFAVRSSIRQTNPTKEAIDLTRRAFVAEHRTWIQVSPQAGEIRVEGGKIYCVIDLLAENVGKSPAKFVSLDLTPYQARGFGAGDEERDALVQRAIRFAELGSRGVVLMPSEQSSGRFSAEVETSIRLEAATQAQVDAGVPEGNLTLVLSIAFCVIYKTQASEDWCYTSGIAVLSSRDKTQIAGDFRNVAAENIRITILPSAGKMT